MDYDAKLLRWFVIEGLFSREEGTYCLSGFIYDDRKGRFSRTNIRTSPILKTVYPIEKLKEGLIVQTENSLYLLGDKS